MDKQHQIFQNNLRQNLKDLTEFIQNVTLFLQCYNYLSILTSFFSHLRKSLHFLLYLSIFNKPGFDTLIISFSFCHINFNLPTLNSSFIQTVNISNLTLIK